jgi:hypothetical protein
MVVFVPSLCDFAGEKIVGAGRGIAPGTHTLSLDSIYLFIYLFYPTAWSPWAMA